MLKKLMGSREQTGPVVTPERDDSEATAYKSTSGTYAVSRAVTKTTRTIIGEKITIMGDIHGNEDLVIDGHMKGNIELENNQVSVGPKGRVEAEIVADNVTIGGRLTGNVKALGKVTITREADFRGEIKARSLAVEDGAYLKAMIELERPEPAVAPEAIALPDDNTSDPSEGDVPEDSDDLPTLFSRKYDTGQDT